MFLKDGLRQGLGLNVGHIVLCIDVGNTQDLLSNEVTYMMVTYVYMLRSLVVDLVSDR